MKRPAPILVVDNQPNTRLGYRMALMSVGYAVAEAGDGPAALGHLERSAAGLVLLTLQLPLLGGMETLRFLRAAGNDVPVVIVAPHSRLLDPVAAMKLGVIDFLVRPVTPDLLRGVVDDVFRRHYGPGRGPGAASSPPTAVRGRPVATGLAAAKRALNRREFDRAGELLERTLDLEPDRADASNLKGLLHECRGRANAAYHAYKRALEADPRFAPALDNMRRYCERSGLDFHNEAINPAAGCRGRDRSTGRIRAHRHGRGRAPHGGRSRGEGPARHVSGLPAGSEIPEGVAVGDRPHPSPGEDPSTFHRAGLAARLLGLLKRIPAFPRPAGARADRRRGS
jgi:DNA-binding response OmpR family regulator